MKIKLTEQELDKILEEAVLIHQDNENFYSVVIGEYINITASKYRSPFLLWNNYTANLYVLNKADISDEEKFTVVNAKDVYNILKQVGDKVKEIRNLEAKKKTDKNIKTVRELLNGGES